MAATEFVPEEHYRAAAAAVRARIAGSPAIGLILGSGLGPLVDEIESPQVIPYQDIPHWPHSTVKGHAGRLVFGELEGQPVVVMQGRTHFYEGYSMGQVTLPVRVMRLLGVNTLVVTNAAGGLNASFSAGDIMIIEDHIAFTGLAGFNPLRGPNLDSFGPRFPVCTHIYDPGLRKLAHRVAAENDIPVREGVYVGLAGPSFETPAEVRMLRALGGDSVGMSTAHETIVAYHTGMRVLGFSSITNLSIDDPEASEEVSHEEVLRLGRQIVPRLAVLIRGVLRQMPPYDPAEVENHPEYE